MQEEAWATNDASVSVAAQSRVITWSCPAHVKEEVKLHMGTRARRALAKVS